MNKIVEWLKAAFLYIVQYGYQLRAPLGLWAILLAFVPASKGVSLFWGLVALDKPLYVFFVSLVVYQASAVVMAMTNLVLLYGDVRVGRSAAPNPQNNTRTFIVFVAGFTAATAFVVQCSIFSISQSSGELHALETSIAAVLGFIAAAILVICAKWLQMRWTTPIPGQSPVYLIFPLGWIGLGSTMEAQYNKASSADWLGALFAKFGPGYSQTIAGTTYGLPGHGFAASLATLTAVLYLVAGSTYKILLREPGEGISILGLPTVFHVIVAIMLVSWTIGGLAFFLDRYRVPVIVPLVLVTGAFTLFVDTDHIFLLEPARAGRFPPAVSVIEKSPDKIILVAAAGGGIQAAAWTARVLGSLREENPEFAGAVRFISGVSGGSVGTLHYLTTYGITNEGRVDPEVSIDRATEDSLEGIAWGLTHPDFWRMLFPKMDREVDRGWALQRAIAKSSGTSGLRLTELAAKVPQGVPVFAINSTTVETGGPLVFSTSPLEGSAARAAGIQDFRQVFGESDIDVATAVRLSASFPYISPAARSWIYDPKVHFVDGGYYDTYGMVTTMAWLEDELAKNGGALPANKKILILEIDAFPASDPNQEPAGESHDWPYQLTAPLLALYNARDHGQSFRNNVELESLRKAVPGIAALRFHYVATPPVCDAKPPLSWHLTIQEKACLKAAYSDTRENSAKQCVREFLQSGSSASCRWE